MLENQVNLIYLGIGSNLGDRKKNIDGEIGKNSDPIIWKSNWDE